MNYIPDGWRFVIFRHNDQEVIKVFASWSGGYTQADSWKLNSGCESITEDDNYYYVSGFSGSVYQCSKHGEDRLNAYGRIILSNLYENAISAGAAVELIDVEELKTKYPDLWK